MRSLLIHTAETCLLGLGVDGLARRMNRGRTLVLAYHNIVPEGEEPYGDRSLHLQQAAFARQLDLLGETHEFVPVSELHGGGEPGGKRSRPRVAVTFDDAYRGALTAGVEEIRRRGLPATVFVAPGLLGREAFWWDLLDPEAPTTAHGPPREHALTALGGRHEDVVRWAADAGLLLDPPAADHARPATRRLLRSAAREPEITLAPHGWNHLNLPVAGGEQLDDELSKPLEWFERQGLPYRRWIAFPYGHHTQRARDAARRIYSLGFTTTAAYTDGVPPDAMSVPRMNVPAGLAPRRFRLLTSGAMNLLSRDPGA